MSQKDEKATTTCQTDAAPKSDFTVEELRRAKVAGAACGCSGLPAAVLGYQRHLRAEPVPSEEQS